MDIMKDYFGQEIVIGNIVVYYDITEGRFPKPIFHKGRVIGKTEKMIIIEQEDKYGVIKKAPYNTFVKEER